MHYKGQFWADDVLYLPLTATLALPLKLWQPLHGFLCQGGITECKVYEQNCLRLKVLFNPKWTFLSKAFHRARAAEEVNSFLSVSQTGTYLFLGVIFLMFGVSEDPANERKLDSCFSNCRSD